jgi:hypothetical protein
MKWKTPFRRLLKYFEDANGLLVLCMNGISTITKTVPLVKALMDQSPNIDSDEKEKSVNKARIRAELAQSEIDKGFPLLHANTLVGTWGALESTIIDFLIIWLINEPTALKREEFSKIKIILAEYETLEAEERMRFLINELERSLRSKFKDGISRFEAILSIFDLSGEVDENIRKTLYEMFHIRNVIVHRASIADRKFIKACPWLGYSIGDSVRVSHDDWSQRYLPAVVEYSAQIIERVNLYLKTKYV